MESRVRGRDDRAPARRPSAWEPLTPAPTPTPAVEPRPLLRPGPRSVMYVPLVVLAAVLPGLFALRNWDLNPPGPWWGLRALAALDGHVLDQVPAALAMGRGPEALAFRSVAMQPPLYAWLAAVGLGLGPDRSPLGAVLPSYVAGAVVVALVYRLGRLGGGPGLGLAAAALTGFSRDLLSQMQQPSPATLGLAGALTTLWGYGEYLASGGGGDRRRRRWAALAALGLAASLLSVRMVGLATIPVVLLHRLAGPPERTPAVLRGSRPSWRRAWRAWSGLVAGAATLAAALALASPWYLMMFSRYGREFLGALWEPPSLVRPAPSGLLGGLVMAPAT